MSEDDFRPRPVADAERSIPALADDERARRYDDLLAARLGEPVSADRAARSERTAAGALATRTPLTEGASALPRAPRTATGRTRRGALARRVVTGVIGTAAVAGLVWAAATVPVPVVNRDVPAATVEPLVQTTERVCAGPLLQATEQGGQLTTTTVGQASPSIAGASGVPQQGASGEGASAVTIRSETPAGKPAGGFMAAQRVDLAPGDAPVARGFLATQCQSPAASSWLFADSGTKEVSSVLSIVNPTDRPSRITLGVATESGLLNLGTAGEFELPAKSQRNLPVAGLAPNATTVAVHVASSGGLVTASVHERLLRGASSRGASITAGMPDASTSATIVGFPLKATAPDGSRNAALTRNADGGSGSAQAVAGGLLRLMAPASGPGADSVDATVVFRGEDGREAHRQTVRMAPNTPTTVALDGIPDGRYNISIEARSPVLAAAKSYVASATAEDAGWFLPSSTVSGDLAIPVPTGPGAAISVANPRGEPAAVNLTDPNGVTTRIDVPPAGSVTVPVAGGAWSASGLSGARVAVTYAGDGMLAGFPVSAGDAIGGSVRVVR